MVERRYNTSPYFYIRHLMLADLLFLGIIYFITYNS